MLRKATSIVAYREGDDISAVTVVGGPCAEHEQGMVPFVRAMGMVPRGYGFKLDKPVVVGPTVWGRRPKACRRPARHDGSPVDELVLGDFAKEALRGGDLANYVEDDWAAVLRNSEGLVAAFDEHSVVLAATSTLGSDAINWVLRATAKGTLGLRFSKASLTLVDDPRVTWYTDPERLRRSCKAETYACRTVAQAA